MVKLLSALCSLLSALCSLLSLTPSSCRAACLTAAAVSALSSTATVGRAAWLRAPQAVVYVDVHIRHHVGEDPWCCESVSRVTAGFCEGVTSVLQRCYKSVMRVSQRCNKGVTRLLQECYKSVTRASRALYQIHAVSSTGTTSAERNQKKRAAKNELAISKLRAITLIHTELMLFFLQLGQAVEVLLPPEGHGVLQGNREGCYKSVTRVLRSYSRRRNTGFCKHIKNIT
jgi:hypothetical protein